MNPDKEQGEIHKSLTAAAENIRRLRTEHAQKMPNATTLQHLIVIKISNINITGNIVSINYS